MANDFQLACILFDLDGTLLDTALDLIGALNVALLADDLPTASYDSIRPYISFGAAVMIEKSLNSSASTTMPNSDLQARLLKRMLQHYEQHIAKQTRLFTGMLEVLQTLELKNIKWGIVTNKHKRFTEPLMQALQLSSRSACIISSDSTNHCKPHPEPMFAACKQTQVKPEDCIYIGDSAHDIAAGNSAGMKTLAATYGYLKPGDKPDLWGAEALIDQPTELMQWL